MKILACDTSTLLGSVAVSDSHGIITQRSLQRAGSHSDSINEMIRDCLLESKIKLDEIDIFLSGLGPGSFTGIRISLNTVKALAYVNQKRCSGFDSLFIIAEQAKFSSSSITVMINAFKNMVYIAEYKSVDDDKFKKRIEVIKSPQVIRVQDLKFFLNPDSLILGDGYLAYENYLLNHMMLKLNRRPEISDFPYAATQCQVFLQKNNLEMNQIESHSQYHWSKLVPLYLRASEAEENLAGIKYIGL